MIDKVLTIYVDDIVPASKKAVEEAVSNCPDHVFVKIRSSADPRVPFTRRPITEMRAGESLAYTDGKGKYYGRITRTAADPIEFVFDRPVHQEKVPF